MSWMLVRVMASAYSATKGSSIFITGLTGYLVRYGYVRNDHVQKGGPLFLVAWLGIAFCGVYWQVSSGFRLPFPVNVVLFPITIAEKLLVGLVGSKSL
jgi:hypothetical protein